MKKKINKLAQVKIMNIIDQESEGYDELDKLYDQAKDIYNDGMVELVDNETPIHDYQSNTRLMFGTPQTQAIRNMALYNFAKHHSQNRPLRKELSKASQIKLDIILEDVEHTSHGAIVQQMPDVELHFNQHIKDVYSVSLKRENKYTYNLMLEALINLDYIESISMILPTKDGLIIIDGATKRKLKIHHNGKPQNIPNEVIRAIGTRLERNDIIIADAQQPQQFSRRIMKDCERPLPLGVSLNRDKINDSDNLYHHICERLYIKPDNIEDYEIKDMEFNDKDVSIQSIRDIIEYYAKD